MFICPVCRSRTVIVYGETSTAKCEACGTYDALHKFEAAIVYTDPNGRVPEAIFPPDEIVACVEKLRTYFVDGRGAKQWAFGHVQSRDEPALIGIEHVRNMAQAFRMELVVRPQYLDFIAKMEEILKAAQAGASEQNVPLHEVAPFVVNEVAAYLFPASE